MRKIILASAVFLSCITIGIAQTYISLQQKTTTNGFTDRVETKLTKRVVIESNQFRAELPEGGEISGNIELFKTIERDDDKRIIYNIEGGGLLTIYDDFVDNNWDCVTLNLLATSKKKMYTFWLTKGNKGDD